MSNNVHITSTKFINTKLGNETLGVRVYDDIDSVYCNTWESIPDDDLDVLKQVISYDVASELMDYVRSYQKSICIDETWYTWEEIKEIII